VAQEGKSRAKTGYNTQKNALQTTKLVNLVKQLKTSDLGTQQTRPDGKNFKQKHGR
jgi:hypothetical protein